MAKDQSERIARWVLVATALVFASFGVAFMIAPMGIAREVDITLGSSRAVVELVTFYGGLELGIAVAIFLCSRRQEWLRPGLVIGVASLGSAALVRAGAMLATATADGLLFTLLIAEVSGALINAWALRINARHI